MIHYENVCIRVLTTLNYLKVGYSKYLMHELVKCPNLHFFEQNISSLCKLIIVVVDISLFNINSSSILAL